MSASKHPPVAGATKGWLVFPAARLGRESAAPARVRDGDVGR
ncbi:hypothetical protein RCH16_000283 [Cryobacterium sp. MP_M5]|nr:MULTISPECIES: hypothetical protein [unclassified Cryobacterium]MBG6057097.1 hypothetical protein [Cryobacterium sp. MP_M3]MEC5175296.1 hypothetical protein [Cryobacterium sp. MP_M5]